MSRSRAVFVVLAVTLMAGGWLVGDEPKKEPPPKSRRTLPPNWNKLGLTTDQKEKIYATRTEYGVKIDELKRKIKELEDKEKAEMLGVLTEAQKTRLRELATEKIPGGIPPKEDKKPDAKKPTEDKKS